MKRDQLYSLIGVGIGLGLVTAMVWALNNANKAAAAKAGGSNTGAIAPQDPWGPLKTRIGLLNSQLNSLAQLTTFLLPSVHQISLDGGDVLWAANQIALGATLDGRTAAPPPASDTQLTALGQAVGKLLADAPAASTVDTATAQTVAGVVGAANDVLTAAVTARGPAGNA